MNKNTLDAIKGILYAKDNDGAPLPAHTKVARLQNYLENMQKERRFVMIVLDGQPDGTSRLFYWSRYGNGGAGTLTQNIKDASIFKSAKDCENAFDNDGGDSYLQQENGDILTYDKTRGDAGDYTYERYILEI